MKRAAILLCLAAAASAQEVSVWLTTNDQKILMEPQSGTSFGAAIPSSTPVVIIDERQRAQTIEGFGASMTDSSAYLLNQRVQPSDLPSVMNWLFDRDKGIGVSFLRNPMGASDLARYHYSYDDLNAGETDPDMARFSVAHDEADILPLLRQARAINPSIRMMGTPWSPPGWMKTTGSMVRGALLPTARAALANYLVAYLKAYEAAGVPVDYLSIQNEPLYVPNDYPGSSMPAAEQAAVLKDYVLPALTANGLKTKVLVYDHNWDTTDYPKTVLADASLSESPQIAGVAWHWYGGPPGAMTTLHNLHPGLGQYVTEASGGTWIADEVRADFEMIVHSMRNWGRAYVKWGLALNENRGPHAGGCGTCTGLVTVNEGSGAVTRTIDYYTLGHFSKFVLPGAARVWSSNVPGIISAAFLNPDGSRVLVAFNEGDSSRAFRVEWNGRSFDYSLPSFAGATFTWRNAIVRGHVSPPRGPVRSAARAYSIKATQQIQASSYNDVSGAQTEACTDKDGGFDLGYTTDGAWAEYRFVDFGTGVSKLNLRVASGGAGGTVEFHIESPTGPLVARATLPVTGGWQSWSTVTASASGATGIQTVYMVIRANNGNPQIGNLNWFRFE